MASFPRVIKHGSGRILRIQNDFLAVRFNPEFNIKDKRVFLDKFNAELEFVEQKNGFKTSDRYDWISPNESKDMNFPPGFVDTLDKEFPKEILNVSPIYKFDKVPGRGAYTTIISDVLLIRFSDYITDKEIPRYAKLMGEYGLEYDEEFSKLLGVYNYFLLSTDRQENIFDLKEKLIREIEGIKNVEFDYLPVYSPLHLKPDDEYYHEQWNMVQIKAGGTDLVPSGTAWDENTGSTSVVVAILDRGVQLNHPDLIPNLYSNGFKVDTSLDVSQRVIAGGEPVRMVGIGANPHGTEVAGIISARINNGIPFDESETKEGVAGLAGGLDGEPTSGCKLLPIALAEFSSSNLGASIWLAASQGANVLNISFGSISWDTDVVSSIIDVQVSLNQVVICASTGNDTSASFIDFPASHLNVLACGASDKSDLRKPESNYLSGSNPNTGVTVVAPGVDIPTTTFLETIDGLDPGYLPIMSGASKIYFGETSAAAAHVSGLAALILSKNNTLSAQEVRNYIEQNADKENQSIYVYCLKEGFTNGPWDEQVGYGRINVLRTLSAVPSPPMIP